MHSDKAYVLHKKPYKDSSELVKLLGQSTGIIDVISKGSRNPKSPFKGQLQPFIESQISYVGRSALKTLIQAEQVGINQACAYLNHVSMLYCNELILLLNFNDDLDFDLYSEYAKTIELLKQNAKVSLILRKFEWYLCCALGYQPSLPADIKPSDSVVFCPTNGLEINQHIKTCTAQSFELFIDEQPLSAVQLKEVNQLMRTIINHMVHGKTIQSRALLINQFNAEK